MEMLGVFLRGLGSLNVSLTAPLLACVFVLFMSCTLARAQGWTELSLNSDLPFAPSNEIERWLNYSTQGGLEWQGSDSDSEESTKEEDPPFTPSSWFDKVEAFVEAEPSRSKLLDAAKHPVSYGLGPLSQPPLLNCEAFPSIKLYDEKEAVRLPGHGRIVDLGSFKEARTEYAQFVTKHRKEQKEQHKALLSRKTHKRLGVGVLQWNALMLRPSAFDLLWAVMDGVEGDGRTPVDKLDMLVVFLHENLRYKSARHEQRMLRNVQHVLNVLSSVPNWGSAKIKFLKNLIGTSLRIGRANTQAVLWIVRKTGKSAGKSSSPVATKTCVAQYAMGSREKGFMSVVFDVPQLGRVAFMGLHLSGWDAPSFRAMLASLVDSCDEEGKGLASFDGGIVVTGDWNEHLHDEALVALRSSMESRADRNALADYPALKHALAKSSLHPRNLMAKALTVALMEGPESISRQYMPILWAVDRLGRMPMNSKQKPGPGNAEPVAAALRDIGFNQITACYRGGWTYKYSRNCRPKSDGNHPFSRVAHCLHGKILQSSRGAGYLDRLATRVPSAVGEDGLPNKAAIITGAKQIFAPGSDHTQQYTTIDFMYR